MQIGSHQNAAKVRQSWYSKKIEHVLIKSSQIYIKHFLFQLFHSPGIFIQVGKIFLIYTRPEENVRWNINTKLNISVYVYNSHQ
jgi:hypothetical protein